jgi:SAM-dependent methyltransferase
VNSINSRSDGSTQKATDGQAELDALLAGNSPAWWDRFYENRARAIPFFVASPDENLARWVDSGRVHRGRAIDFGCGNGRNSVFLASRGFQVEAVDQSQAAIDWATQNVARAGVSVQLLRQSVFELNLQPAAYDLVYDSGCFHHIPPHRRSEYVERITRALRPGGWLGLTCFRPEGGSGFSDDDVYERGSLGGGLGYTQERLREIWSQGLKVESISQMNEQLPDSGRFGKSFLWVLLARKL